MTYEEMKALQRGYPPFILCGFVDDNFEHHYVQPVPDDQMAHAKSEKPSTDFNGLSLEQAAVSSRYKYMDPLHKADAVAADLSKGERLITELNEVGENTFVSRRFEKSK